MSIGLFTINHSGRIGKAWLETASYMLDTNPLYAEGLEMHADSELEELRVRVLQLTERLDQDGGVPRMTGMHGSIPGNIAYDLLQGVQFRHQPAADAGMRS